MIERKIVETWINEMNEADFRNKALIPLFKEMRFNNVFHYHGGPGELGKDIVMWKNNDFRKRENYAVIVKTGIITGKVNGKGSFTDIVIQIEQALGSKYIDESSLEELSIDRCIFVSNYSQKKETISALSAAISEKIKNRSVTIFDYNSLVDLLIQYKIMPNTADALMQALEIVDPKNEISSVLIKRNGTKKQIGIEYDSRRLDDNGSFTFSFPEDEAGLKVKNQYIDFFKKGTKVEIPKEYIQSLVFPKFLEHFSSGTSIEKIVLGPRTILKKIILDLMILKNRKMIFEYNNLEFAVLAMGEESIQLEHNSDISPFILNLSINIKKSLELTCRKKEDWTSFSVYEIFQYFKFLDSFAENNELTILDSKTKLRLASGKINTNAKQNNNFWLDIFEKASFIQRETNTILFVPKEQLKREDINDINELYNIIKNGYNRNIVGKFELSDINEDAVKKYINLDTNQNLDIVLSINGIYNILNKDIDIGEVKYYIKKGKVNYLQDTKILEIDLLPESPALAIYTKYLKDQNKIQDDIAT